MNPDAIRCPRCDETTETFTRRGAGGASVRALPVFLGAALSAHGTCSRCGCLSASRCSH